MTHVNEYSPEGYAETDRAYPQWLPAALDRQHPIEIDTSNGCGEPRGIDTRRIARPAFDFAALILLAGFAACYFFCGRAIDQREDAEQRLSAAQTELAEMLDRNKAANAEIVRLRAKLNKQLASPIRNGAAAPIGGAQPNGEVL